MDASFRELLQRYKNHTASPQEQEKVEQALEAFEAINDYLSEQLEQLEEEPSLALSSQQDPLSDTALLRMVKRSIRTAFLKLGAGVLAVTLAVEPEAMVPVTLRESVRLVFCSVVVRTNW